MEKEENFPHLVLTKFFTKEWYTKKEKLLKKLSFKRQSRPNAYSFTQAKASSLHILDQKELLDFLSTILGREIKNILGEAYTFSWKDYTLLKNEQEKSSIDIIIDFTPDWKEEWGGSIVYKNAKGKYLKLMALPNALIIIQRKNEESYMQYINNLSKGKKRYIILGKAKGK